MASLGPLLRHDTRRHAGIFVVGGFAELKSLHSGPSCNNFQGLSDKIGHDEILFSGACRQQDIYGRVRAFLRTRLGILLLDRLRIACARDRKSVV